MDDFPAPGALPDPLPARSRGNGLPGKHFVPLLAVDARVTGGRVDRPDLAGSNCLENLVFFICIDNGTPEQAYQFPAAFTNALQIQHVIVYRIQLIFFDGQIDQ